MVGDLCNVCAPNTTRIFPSCEPCDECTEQWIRRIEPLEEQVQGTIEFVSSLNLTNMTLDIPLLDELLEMARDIEMILSNSTIDMLVSDVENLCVLINRTDDLITRGEVAQADLDRIGTDAQDIEMSLPMLMNGLERLREDFENVSMIFASQEFLSVNSTLYIEQARESLRRSDAAEQLIRENATSILNETISAINSYNASLEENNVLAVNERLSEMLANINSTVEELQMFISVVSQSLCGTENEMCLECADESCDLCPSGLRCDGLIARADLASNTSMRALVMAEDVLEQIMAEVESLEELLARARGVQRGADEVANIVSELRNASLELIENIRSLTTELERELTASRVDPNDIGRLENMTLSLELDLLPNEVSWIQL